MIRPYDDAVENRMFMFYNSLSEKDKRRYAAIEVLKLPYGGRSYIHNILNCSYPTIDAGIEDLKCDEISDCNQVRNSGGGRKSSIESITGIDDLFLKILKDFTAGDPMNQKVKWTHLTYSEIIEAMSLEGINISKPIVKKLFKRHGYVKRKACKSIKLGTTENRNEQFENIAEKKQLYENTGNPVISVDTKKKELIGNLHRDGQLHTQETIEVYDHDFPYLADGVAIPHGIYDIQLNTAYINIGISHDTCDFSCDSMKRWWNFRGRYDYPDASSILVLVDCGGSNGYRHYVFKRAIQQLADAIGIEICIAHYPSYASKWNPIEHRLFPHITRKLKGVILKSVDMVKQLIETTTTKTGLTVKCNIIKKMYETGKKMSKEEKEELVIIHDDYLGHWNYTAIPSNS